MEHTALSRIQKLLPTKGPHYSAFSLPPGRGGQDLGPQRGLLDDTKSVDTFPGLASSSRVSGAGVRRGRLPSSNVTEHPH